MTISQIGGPPGSSYTPPPGTSYTDMQAALTAAKSNWTAQKPIVDTSQAALNTAMNTLNTAITTALQAGSSADAAIAKAAVQSALDAFNAAKDDYTTKLTLLNQYATQIVNIEAVLQNTLYQTYSEGGTVPTTIATMTTPPGEAWYVAPTLTGTTLTAQEVTSEDIQSTLSGLSSMQALQNLLVGATNTYNTLQAGIRLNRLAYITLTTEFIAEKAGIITGTDDYTTWGSGVQGVQSTYSPLLTALQGQIDTQLSQSTTSADAYTLALSNYMSAARSTVGDTSSFVALMQQIYQSQQDIIAQDPTNRLFQALMNAQIASDLSAQGTYTKPTQSPQFLALSQALTALQAPLESTAIPDDIMTFPQLTAPGESLSILGVMEILSKVQLLYDALTKQFRATDLLLAEQKLNCALLMYALLQQQAQMLKSTSVGYVQYTDQITANNLARYTTAQNQLQQVLDNQAAIDAAITAANGENEDLVSLFNSAAGLVATTLNAANNLSPDTINYLDLLNYDTQTYPANLFNNMTDLYNIDLTEPAFADIPEIGSQTALASYPSIESLTTDVSVPTPQETEVTSTYTPPGGTPVTVTTYTYDQAKVDAYNTAIKNINAVLFAIQPILLAQQPPISIPLLTPLVYRAYTVPPDLTQTYSNLATQMNSITQLIKQLGKQLSDFGTSEVIPLADLRKFLILSFPIGSSIPPAGADTAALTSMGGMTFRGAAGPTGAALNRILQSQTLQILLADYMQMHLITEMPVLLALSSKLPGAQLNVPVGERLTQPVTQEQLQQYEAQLYTVAQNLLGAVAQIGTLYPSIQTLIAGSEFTTELSSEELNILANQIIDTLQSMLLTFVAIAGATFIALSEHPPGVPREGAREAPREGAPAAPEAPEGTILLPGTTIPIPVAEVQAALEFLLGAPMFATFFPEEVVATGLPKLLEDLLLQNVMPGAPVVTAEQVQAVFTKLEALGITPPPVAVIGTPQLLTSLLAIAEQLVVQAPAPEVAPTPAPTAAPTPPPTLEPALADVLVRSLVTQTLRQYFAPEVVQTGLPELVQALLMQQLVPGARQVTQEQVDKVFTELKKLGITPPPAEKITTPEFLASVLDMAKTLLIHAPITPANVLSAQQQLAEAVATAVAIELPTTAEQVTPFMEKLRATEATLAEALHATEPLAMLALLYAPSIAFEATVVPPEAPPREAFKEEVVRALEYLKLPEPVIAAVREYQGPISEAIQAAMPMIVPEFIKQLNVNVEAIPKEIYQTIVRQVEEILVTPVFTPEQKVAIAVAIAAGTIPQTALPELARITKEIQEQGMSVKTANELFSVLTANNVAKTKLWDSLQTVFVGVRNDALESRFVQRVSEDFAKSVVRLTSFYAVVLDFLMNPAKSILKNFSIITAERGRGGGAGATPLQVSV